MRIAQVMTKSFSKGLGNGLSCHLLILSFDYLSTISFTKHVSNHLLIPKSGLVNPSLV